MGVAETENRRHSESSSRGPMKGRDMQQHAIKRGTRACYFLFDFNEKIRKKRKDRKKIG